MNIHFIWGYKVTDLLYLPLHESIFRRSRNLKLFPTFDILVRQKGASDDSGVRTIVLRNLSDLT